MEGTVTSYLDTKGYGFVRGDDGRDYFLHRDDIAPGVEPAHGLRLAFEETATPKGYRARSARVVAPAEARWELPPDLLTSKEMSVRGWELLEQPAWLMRVSTRESPDEARRLVCAAAREAGASGVLGLHYSKSRGSEAGTGRGVHHYTIHHYSGVPAMLARKTYSGGCARGELMSLNVQLSLLKQHLEGKTRSARRTATITALLAFLIIGVGGALVTEGLMGGIPLLAGVIVAALLAWMISHDHDSWLEPL